MGSEQLPLRNVGIYRNLPTFPPTIKDMTAIIVGATGISGFNTLRSLLESPSRWGKIYAVSRSPPPAEMLSLLTPTQQSHLQHVSIDLTGSAEKTADALRTSGVKHADHVFFFGYIHPKGKSAMDPGLARELVETNAPLFENFLRALPLAGIAPKRILLQTGGKHYGCHIGRARLPYVESDPPPTHLAENFYYHQVDALRRFCAEHPETAWNVVRPFGIVGAAPGGGMNCFLPYAVLAATQAKKGEPIFFGGDIEEWQNECVHSSARLTGFLCEWAVLEEKCANQDFNAGDGCAMSFDRFFEELARWYGVEKGIEGPEPDESKYEELPLAGGKDAPLGYGPPTAIRLSRKLSDWCQEPANHEAWKAVMRDAGLKEDVFELGSDTIAMGDFTYYRIGQPSMAKVRRLGFNGFVDTVESVFEAYNDLAVLGLIPKPNVEAARPMV